MNNFFIDLHVHTNASDGTDAPAEVVREAARLGLAALAVTDHDTLEGLPEAEAAAENTGLELIRGCEISTNDVFGEVHILGLWLPRQAARLAPLLAELARIRELRDERNRRMVDRLRSLGIPADYDAVRALAGRAMPGRPHFAAYLVRIGAADNLKDAYIRFLRDGGAAYVPRQSLAPEEAVALLAGTGATVCLAHPGLCRCDSQTLENLLLRLMPHGLTALEAYHSEHSPTDERWCADMAARHQLMLSGGSDYHGGAKPDVALGRGKGGLRVTRHVLEKLKEGREARGLPL